MFSSTQNFCSIWTVCTATIPHSFAPVNWHRFVRPMRCTFVRCLFISLTYIWQYSLQSLFYLEHLHLNSVDGCMQRNENLLLKIHNFSCNESCKPHCLNKQGMFSDPEKCQSRRFFSGIAKHGYIISLFFLAHYTANLKLHVLALHMKN